MKLTKLEIVENILKSHEKGKIHEIVDTENNLIGTKDKPEYTPDAKSMANRTTDHNARVHGQNFKNDFLGRFGFYFYESENGEKPKIYNDLVNIVGEEKAGAVLEAMKSYIDEIFNQANSNIVSEEN